MKDKKKQVQTVFFYIELYFEISDFEISGVNCIFIFGT